MATNGRGALQCSTGTLWTLALEDALDAIAEAGFTDVELMVTRHPDTHEPAAPARLAAERGLRIATVHGPFLAITRSVWGTQPIEKIRRGLDMCRALGAALLVVHPPYLWEGEFAAWVARESAALSQRSGVVVAFETMYPKWIGRRRVRAYRWTEPWELFVNTRHVVMDTSHVAVAREGLEETYALLRPKLAHIHLSDNAGDGRDGHLEIGDGILDIDGLLTDLRRTRYRGTIALEVSVRRHLERPHAVVEALRRNREYVEQRLDPTTDKEPGQDD
jgi:sugar phosphate isomerase/epimerase